MTFKTLERTEEIDGLFVQCDGCGEVIISGEEESHVCPAIVDECDVAIDKALAVMSDSNASAADRLSAYDDYEIARKIRWEGRIAKVKLKYNPRVMRKMITEKFQELIDYVRVQKDLVYKKNDDLRAQGVPFGERQRLLDRNRLEMLDRFEASFLQERMAFVPLPIEDWFTESDYEWAASKGMKRVITFNFERTYVLSKNNYVEKE